MQPRNMKRVSSYGAAQRAIDFHRSVRTTTTANIAPQLIDKTRFQSG
ncbi:Uncharacterised protein [Yersinia similis]|uniref:Uncharacterized protein n=1 Tax=Yersinia similis TaxID=367190 RepID=A0A0T9RR47_9GAMM|nr:Uncharacterised protein [Yersinia similis]CNC60762.1 Uncharacterised protein [Yersinia similis]CNF72025.1 Uncharacterised protein [Yersinia similis]CNG66146.1 Uncharacterised protein [Yersinia similis]CNI78518.1 Uncharacterised protein [Yersinia similis]